MKNRLLLTALLVLLAFVLVACNAGSPTTTTTTPIDTTIAPETTAAPATTAAPETTAAPATTAAPETTAAPATTAKPAETTAPMIERVDPAPVSGVTYANDYMDQTSDELTMYCAQVLTGDDATKSDGFTIVYKNEVYVIDGGTANLKNVKTTLDYLLEIRKTALEASHLPDTNRFKLRINLIVSHFHADHVGATYTNIIPNQYIEIGHVFYQEDSEFTTAAVGKSYYDASHWGSVKHRPKYTLAINRYSPNAITHVIQFGETCTFPSLDGKVIFRFFGAPIDWASGDVDDPSTPLGHIVSNYYHSGINPESLNTNLENMNSMWVKIEYGERSLLFTGDINKSQDMGWTSKDEPLDRMINYYGTDIFKCDVVKYPHHGQQRDMALNAVIRVMDPSLMIFTLPAQTVTQAGMFRYYYGSWADTAVALTVKTDGHALSYAPDGEHYNVIYE